MYIYIDMYVYIYIYINMHLYIYIYTYMHICIFTHIGVDVGGVIGYVAIGISGRSFRARGL